MVFADLRLAVIDEQQPFRRAALRRCEKAQMRVLVMTGQRRSQYRWVIDVNNGDMGPQHSG
jgi:hypothetical protein